MRHRGNSEEHEFRTKDDDDDGGGPGKKLDLKSRYRAEGQRV